MSHFLDRLSYFSQPQEGFSGKHGLTTGEDRTWEDAYRDRWAHDKIVRSTHGVNCTGSCSWKIYVKGGIVTWETQQTDYPRTRPDPRLGTRSTPPRINSYTPHAKTAPTHKKHNKISHLTPAANCRMALEFIPGKLWAPGREPPPTRDARECEVTRHE